ncbi:hypothetical protein V6N12_024338 [Hibiscus sabdariffa]|uniref:Uncharacterized protein n=1 Tax=Hibiscus sabdariffa TaxID=183260 RepID=A0ABR2G101_9ROSI
MVASSSLIKVFFNEEIHKKYEDQFDSRPFIFEKPFDTKNEPNVGFSPEFMAIVKEHKNKILVDLCEMDTTWTVSPEGIRLVKRRALKSQARGCNHFLKAILMPTSHNETVS